MSIYRFDSHFNVFDFQLRKLKWRKLRLLFGWPHLWAQYVCKYVLLWAWRIKESTLLPI